MSNPTIDVKVVDNVFVKLHRFKNAGDTYQGHSHVFDHITLLATGSVLMKHDKGEKQYTAPYLIVTPKNITHEFTALEDGTVFCCIHAVRDGSEVDDVASQDITAEQAFELLTTYSVTKSE